MRQTQCAETAFIASTGCSAARCSTSEPAEASHTVCPAFPDRCVGTGEEATDLPIKRTILEPSCKPRDQKRKFRLFDSWRNRDFSPGDGSRCDVRARQACAILLTRALPEIPVPDECRNNPPDCEHCHGPTGGDEVPDEGNGDQRIRDRTHQCELAPGQAREIHEPEDRREAPVKRRVPRTVAKPKRDDRALGEIE